MLINKIIEHMTKMSHIELVRLQVYIKKELEHRKNNELLRKEMM